MSFLLKINTSPGRSWRNLLAVMLVLISTSLCAKDSDTLWTRELPPTVQGARPFFSDDDKTIILAGRANALVMSTQTGKTLQTIDSVTILKRFDDGTKYLGKHNGVPLVIDAINYKRLPITFMSATHFTPMKYDVSPNGKRIYGSSYVDGPLGVVVWNAETGDIIEEIDLEEKTGDTIGSTKWKSNGEIFTTADGGTVVLSAYRTTYGFDGKHYYWMSNIPEDLYLRAYRVSDKQLVFASPHIMATAEYRGTTTPDRKQLIVVDYMKNMMVSVSTADGSTLREHPELPNMDFVFTDDMAYIASGGGVGGGLPVFDFKTARRVSLYKLTGYTGWSFADISHDRKFIVATVGQNVVLFVADWTSDVEKDGASNAGLIPNPASQRVQIELSSAMLSGTLSIYSSSGQLVNQIPASEVSKLSPTTIALDISALGEGSYVLKCRHDGIDEQFMLMVAR